MLYFIFLQQQEKIFNLTPMCSIDFGGEKLDRKVLGRLYFWGYPTIIPLKKKRKEMEELLILCQKLLAHLGLIILVPFLFFILNQIFSFIVIYTALELFEQTYNQV